MDNEVTVAVMNMVVEALIERGYNPYAQIKGYLLEDEPTYITSHRGARKAIQTIDKKMVSEYLNNWEKYQDKKWRIEFVRSHF